MIRTDGWKRYSIWEHSAIVRDLYTRRSLRQVEEMTCHAQAAELLTPFVSPGDSLLDVGCGSGYFFHSLQSRRIPVAYTGMDASPTLLDIGRRIMPAFGLDSHRLIHLRLDDLAGEVDHVVCINVLTNLDNYHRPLERLLRCAKKTLILRESLSEAASYRYVNDDYLDPGYRLCVHVNTYDVRELTTFIRSYGFNVHLVEDRRSRGQPEIVIGYPHHWTFVVAQRKV